MAIEFNSTLNQFVNWANQDGIVKTDLVHVTKTQGATGDAKITVAANKNDGIGFAAWRRRGADVKDLNNATRKLFMQAVMDLFGAKTINDIPKSVRDKMKLDDYDGEGHPLSAHRIRSVANAARIALAYRAFSVSGSGEAATMLKGVVNAKMATLQGSKSEKAVALKNEMDRRTKKSFNLGFATDMKELQGNVGSQFSKDHNRPHLVPKFKVGNETLTFDGKTPFGEKQDIIAKFVKKDMNATFADLKGADLNKAYAVMAIYAQRFAIAILDGITNSLAATPTSLAPIQFIQSNDASKSTLEFSFGDDGAFCVHFTNLYDNPQIMKNGEHFRRVFGECNTGSSVNIVADVKIDADEFEKLANTDYTQFDDTVPTAVMPREQEEEIAGVGEKGKFRFGEGVNVSVSCTAVLNGGQVVLDDEF